MFLAVIGIFIMKRSAKFYKDLENFMTVVFVRYAGRKRVQESAAKKKTGNKTIETEHLE